MTSADCIVRPNSRDDAPFPRNSARCLDQEILVVRSALLGEPLEYVPVWDAMRAFTAERGPETADEIWLLSHRPVFTQGQAGKPEHLLNPGEIPVVQIDRGGQVTYHGPGQLVAYLLVDVRRAATGVRELVDNIENSLIEVLSDFGISAQCQRKAPGVYVNGAKIAALGLRIRQGCSYHGLSFNIDMDLTPFRRINPCGYEGMEVTQLRDLLASGHNANNLIGDVAGRLIRVLAPRLGYVQTIFRNFNHPGQGGRPQ